MANLVALGLMVSDKKIFKDFRNSVPMETGFFDGIKSESLKEDHGRIISVTSHQNWMKDV